MNNKYVCVYVCPDPPFSRFLSFRRRSVALVSPRPRAISRKTTRRRIYRRRIVDRDPALPLPPPPLLSSVSARLKIRIRVLSSRYYNEPMIRRIINALIRKRDGIVDRCDVTRYTYVHIYIYFTKKQRACGHTSADVTPFPYLCEPTSHFDGPVVRVRG